MSPREMRRAAKHLRREASGIRDSLRGPRGDWQMPSDPPHEYETPAHVVTEAKADHDDMMALADKLTALAKGRPSGAEAGTVPTPDGNSTPLNADGK